MTNKKAFNGGFPPSPITELTTTQKFTLAQMKHQLEGAPPDILKEMVLMAMKETMILRNNVSNLLKNR